MKNVILSLLTLSILGICCQKDKQGTQTPDPVPEKYMNLTAGSTWNYELINNLAATTTPFTLASTSKDSSINTRTYHVFTNSNGTANEYYNISGNDYYNFRNLPAALGGSNVEYLYLKDNIAVGASWSQSFPVTVTGIALTVTLINAIAEKGISKTVKGINYNNVIHVTTTLSITVGGIPLPASALTTDIQSYYAAKTGLIQSANKIDLNYAGFTDHTDEQTNLNTSVLK